MSARWMVCPLMTQSEHSQGIFIRFDREELNRCVSDLRHRRMVGAAL